jgi:cytochrome P450
MKGKYPPGPPAGFLGLGLAARMRKDPLGTLTDIGRTYGDIAYARLGPFPTYFVNHPDLIREVLVTRGKNFRKVPRQTKVFSRIDGNGLVVTEGDFWRRQRRLVQPAFHPKRFGRYGDVTVEYTRRMLEGWSPGAVLDVAQAMTQLTLSIIARTLFDVEVSGQAAELGAAVRVLAEELLKDLSSFVLLPDWLPLPGKLRKRRALRTLDNLIWGIIRQRRASGVDKGDLLSMLLLAVDEESDGTGMTDRQVRDEALTLFNAGHDSTAAGLAWVWYLIARHPEVEARLLAEVRDVLGERPATYEDVARLRYLEMVLKESLRLYPPTVALFIREALEPVELGGYPVAKGDWVYLFAWVTQRDPRFFEEPEKFDPERFAPGRAEKIPPYAYFPFGGGPHVCIGNTFAQMEMALIVATVLQRYRLELAPDQGPVEPELHVAIRPRGGLRLRLARS